VGNFLTTKCHKGAQRFLKTSSVRGLFLIKALPVFVYYSNIHI